MSENKYIIDKDSLTGIADAIRDKLGNGEAITDEDAGYYPVSVKKLGYYEAVDSASYSGPGTGYTSATIYARPVSELENICGMRPSYIKVTVKPSAAFNTNDIIFRCTDPNQPSSTMVSSVRFSNYIAILSIPSDVEDCYVNYGGYYSSYSSQYTTRNIPAYDVVFLDSNQNEININEYSGDSFTINQWGTTKSFLTRTSFEKIPFSIEDIQDKITNYLNASAKPKIAFLSNFLVKGQRSSDGTDLTPYGGLSNIFLIVGIYNGSYLGYLDMVNHPDKVGTYSGYDTYRFYYLNGGTETTLVDAQYYTYNGVSYFYNMSSYYGTEFLPCFIVYKEATE